MQDLSRAMGRGCSAPFLCAAQGGLMGSADGVKKVSNRDWSYHTNLTWRLNSPLRAMRSAASALLRRLGASQLASLSAGDRCCAMASGRSRRSQHVVDVG